MKRHLLLALLGLSVATAPAALAQSAVPLQISYQSKITDAAGALLGSPTPVNRTVTFRIWNHATDATPAGRLYSEQQTVTLAGGEFSVLLGTGTAVAGETNTLTLDNVFTGAVRFLGVTVDDGTAAIDPEISPRQQMVTAPFAFRAKVAEGVVGGAISTAMIANNAVTSILINDSAITDAKLNSGSVLTAKLADSAVTGAKILDGTIATADLANGSVTAAKLGSDVGVWTTSGGNVYRPTGNIGVGTTTPTAPLSAGGAVANTKIAVWDNGTGTGFMGFGVQSSQLRLHTNTVSDRFSFLNAPNGTEVHTVLGNGNVGINHTNPGVPLSFGSAVVPVKIALYESGSDIYGIGMGSSQLRFQLGQSSARYSFFNAPAGSEVFTIGGNGNVGIGHGNPQWGLHIYRSDNARAAFTHDASGGGASDGLHVGSHASAAFLWNHESTPLQLATSGTARLQIEADGRMGFGTTNTSGGIAFLFRAAHTGQVNVMQLLDGNGNEAYTLQHGGNAYKPGGGSWAASSDRRLKTDIQDQHGSLEKLLKLRSVTFYYKDQTRFGAGLHNGFVAQEVKEVFPDWVSTNPDGMMMVGTRGFESLAVQALRELRAEKDAQIAALEARVKELEGRNLTAAQRLDALEQRFNALPKPLVSHATSR